MNDPLGMALKAYWDTGNEQIMKVFSKDVSADAYKASYFFRSFEEMPPQEQKAMGLCKGRVLDVGAGAGSHSVYLTSKGLDVTAIDSSPGCAEVISARGIEKVQIQSIWDHQGQYDTVLLMMNGIGMCGRLKKLPEFLRKLTSLLAPGARIVTDSSDVFHLYGDVDAEEILELDKEYLGEVDFMFEYNGVKGAWFPWVYIDQRTLGEHATKAGLTYKVHYAKKNAGFLATLSLP
ncbi:MAG: methyltransferase domain-containing protein [Bacteroidetes bacterium]|jgi:cyclopropane fatty-acyl-phospholipid synthase-like methyltransferase|nr:methyltransferase domain-containing protein [Bacteroidota bacterium]